MEKKDNYTLFYNWCVIAYSLGFIGAICEAINTENDAWSIVIGIFMAILVIITMIKFACEYIIDEIHKKDKD